jgi:hypothetical protein
MTPAFPKPDLLDRRPTLPPARPWADSIGDQARQHGDHTGTITRNARRRSSRVAADRRPHAEEPRPGAVQRTQGRVALRRGQAERASASGSDQHARAASPRARCPGGRRTVGAHRDGAASPKAHRFVPLEAPGLQGLSWLTIDARWVSDEPLEDQSTSVASSGHNRACKSRRAPPCDGRRSETDEACFRRKDDPQNGRG